MVVNYQKGQGEQMKRPDLMTFDNRSTMEKDMNLEMDYIEKNFDSFSISELYYAIQVLDGEACAVNNFVKKMYGSNAKSEVVEKWYKRKATLENRIMNMRVCIA